MLDFDSFHKNNKGIYVPIRKGKDFNPNPVARDGIPYFADSENNPNCIGTRAYDDWWDEQFDRCINGYITGGINIPGRYYYYLNFEVIKGLYGPMYPWITDLDLEYFLTIEMIKKYKMAGLIALKARRKGLSEKFQAIVNHGIRFIEGYKAAIAAGHNKYVKGLREKFLYGFDNVAPELRLNYTNSNDEIFQAGYYEKTESGSYALRGYGGNIKFASLQDNAEKLEGEYFHDVAMEEGGQFEKLRAGHDSIKPALMQGARMEGTFYIYGTAGNILSTSKDFQFMWQHHEEYNLAKMWIPGRRMYYPFYVNHHCGDPVNPQTFKKETEIDPETKKEIDPIKNLRKYKDYERIGMEDVELASEIIKKQKISLSKLPDKSALIKFNKNFPETEEEAWSSGGNNNFDAEVLNTQIVNLMADEIPLKQYVLDWVYTDSSSGRKDKVFPLKVIARIAKSTDPDYKKHIVFQEPMPEFADLDVGGIDSYNQDATMTTNSLGAMTVMRRYNKLPGYSGNFPGEVPIHLYYKRPKRKEIFYEETLKVAVWYNLVRNTMISAEYDAIIGYWKNLGGEKYLSFRPKTFESKYSKQEHKYGAKMTMHSKPLALGLAQSWLLDNWMYIFYPELLRDFLAYDEEIIESDWDGADSVMLALMRIEDMKRFPRRTEERKESKNSFPDYFYDEDGNVIVSVPNYVDKEKLKQNMDKRYITSTDDEMDKNEPGPFDHLFE